MAHGRHLPGAVPNYATWGPGGALFVTDYAQGVIWKVRRRRQGRPWFRSTALDGVAGSAPRASSSASRSATC